MFSGSAPFSTQLGTVVLFYPGLFSHLTALICFWWCFLLFCLYPEGHRERGGVVRPRIAAALVCPRNSLNSVYSSMLCFSFVSYLDTLCTFSCFSSLLCCGLLPSLEGYVLRDIESFSVRLSCLPTCSCFFSDPLSVFVRFVTFICLGLLCFVQRDIESAVESYDLMSQRLFTHASPTLFNAGTPRPQLSSCFLLSVKEDSIEGIYDTLKQVMTPTKPSTQCFQVTKYIFSNMVVCSNFLKNTIFSVKILRLAGLTGPPLVTSLRASTWCFVLLFVQLL